MSKRASVFVIATSLFLTAEIRAQQVIGSAPQFLGRSQGTNQTTVGISPVPLWPPNGLIPPELAEWYVFYDPNTEEIVIAYPGNLGKADFEKDHGSLVIHRMGTNRGARPTMESEVTPAGGGKFRYTYRLSNAPSAKKSIASFDLVSPGEPDGALIAPPTWRGASMRSRVEAVGAALGTAGATGVLLSWYFMDEQAQVGRGMSLDGFAVSSIYGPGISVAYVTGGVHESPPGGLPDVVDEQLQRPLSKAFNTQSVLTIGPKFAPGTPRSRIAQDYYFGILRMVDTGLLERQSPFVAGILEKLQQYFNQNAEAFARAPFQIAQKPQNQLEQSLLRALTLAVN